MIGRPPHDDPDLVRALIRAQFPQWGEEPVRAVVPGGWCHRTYRIGETRLARLPRALHYAPQPPKEQRWLPVLGPRLPLAVPEVLGAGEPGLGYPWCWSVLGWIDGEAPTAVDERFAHDLAGFLRALWRIDPTGGPRPGLHNFFRGGALATYDGETRDAIDELGDRVDGPGALAVWEAGLAVPPSGPPVWVHGDVAAGNLLVRDGRLRAVLDFGNLAVGDPACDLTIAWTLLDGPVRLAFRDTLALDDDIWARARGWALWKALIRLAEREDPEDRRILGALLR